LCVPPADALKLSGKLLLTPHPPSDREGMEIFDRV
jgi:hypothetical protein